MPPCGFDKETIDPLLLFLRGNYRAIVRLAKEQNKPIEQVMEEELERLNKRLLRLHLTEQGELVERPPP